MISASYWQQMAASWISIYTSEDGRKTAQAVEITLGKTRVDPNQKRQEAEDFKNFLLNMEDDDDEF